MMLLVIYAIKKRCPFSYWDLDWEVLVVLCLETEDMVQTLKIRDRESKKVMGPSSRGGREEVSRQV